MLENSRVAAQLAASQEGLSSRELVILSINLGRRNYDHLGLLLTPLIVFQIVAIDFGTRFTIFRTQLNAGL
jgi:hypothetical protein